MASTEQRAVATPGDEGYCRLAAPVGDHPIGAPADDVVARSKRRLQVGGSRCTPREEVHHSHRAQSGRLRSCDHLGESWSWPTCRVAGAWVQSDPAQAGSVAPTPLVTPAVEPIVAVLGVVGEVGAHANSLAAAAAIDDPHDDVESLVMSVVGIDACKKGWIAIVLRGTDPAEAHLLKKIKDLAAAVPDAEVLAIDIPIGLPESGRRLADLEARAALGKRANSVFFTPVRAALAVATHAEASTISKQVTGAGISQQSFALRAKIFEVEAWLVSAPCDVREVHPEVSFSELLGHPAATSKKSWSGILERRSALEAAGIPLDHIDVAIGGEVGADDVLDAAVAAWTARRVLSDSARSFPDPPHVDSLKRHIAIWA